MAEALKESVEDAKDKVHKLLAQVQEIHRNQPSLQDSLHKYYENLPSVLDDHGDDQAVIRKENYVSFNIAVLITWPLFASFLLFQPYWAHLMNDTWHNYSATYDVFPDRGPNKTSHTRSGLCTTPVQEMHCTDGQNFAELALKHRGPTGMGCGCGQGVFGENLCPMTMYGHTLSDFVSSTPALGAMLGLGAFPLGGAWRACEVINKVARPTAFTARMHSGSLMVFQISYIVWGICSACVFPTGHAVLTVIFLGALFFHWVVAALICLQRVRNDAGDKKVDLRKRLDAWEVRTCVIVKRVAFLAILVIALGSIPRILLVLNDVNGSNFPNLNRGLGSYAFWLAEAVGLSATFGVYPIMLVSFLWLEKKPLEFHFWEPPKVKDLKAHLKVD